MIACRSEIVLKSLLKLRQDATTAIEHFSVAWIKTTNRTFAVHLISRRLTLMKVLTILAIKTSSADSAAKAWFNQHSTRSLVLIRLSPESVSKVSFVGSKNPPENSSENIFNSVVSFSSNWVMTIYYYLHFLLHWVVNWTIAHEKCWSVHRCATFSHVHSYHFDNALDIFFAQFRLNLMKFLNNFDSICRRFEWVNFLISDVNTGNLAYPCTGSIISRWENKRQNILIEVFKIF